MKYLFIILYSLVATTNLAQDGRGNEKSRLAILALIDAYSKARDTKDTMLLKKILTPDMDQLVSSGEWRTGLPVAVQGMLRSSDNNPGTRKFIIEKVRFLDSQNAIVDARYELSGPAGKRLLWSTFIVVYRQKQWKITAIRNMLPVG